jgi:hypothetical protein
MRKVLPLAFMAMLMALGAPLQGQDVTGTWVLTYTQMGRNGQSMERTMEIIFQQSGSDVTGTTMMQMRGRPGGGGGGNPPAPQEVTIEGGKMEGGTLTFDIVRGQGERSMTMTFSSTVEGNTMEGTLAMTGGMRAGGDPIPFKGVKKEG